VTSRVELAFIRAIDVAIKEVAIEVDGPVHCAVECYPATVGLPAVNAKKRVAFIKFDPAIINPIVARTDHFF
jgi:hypothetical protein